MKQKFKLFLEKLFLMFINAFHLKGKYYEYFRNKNNIIIVYSMGKVGSSTIYATLKNNLFSAEIFHIHFLSAHYLENVLPGLHEHYHSNIEPAKKILDYIVKHPYKKIKIITLVRDPVERQVSAVFQNYLPLYSTNDITSVNTEKIISDIAGSDLNYVQNWFRDEFQNYTGFNIYSRPFDKERGYSIYKYKQFDILCIQLEQLSSCFKEALNKFLGLQVDQLATANEAKERSSYLKYQEVKRLLKLNRDHLNSIYASEYVQHFYTDDEIRSFTRRWETELDRK